MADSDMGDENLNIRFRDLAPAFEFISWVVVILAPLLCLANGAPVSSDQFVIQIAIFTVALVGAIGFRLSRIFSR